jgi:predicted transcriptional regulator YdeE
VDPALEQLDGFSVCGLGLDCPDDDNRGIDPLWDRLLARTAELPGSAMYGVSLMRGAGFYYVAGVRAERGAPLPEGMEWLDVPAAEYLRLPYNGDPKRIAATFDRMLDELIPALGRQAAEGACCIEAYPAEDCWDEAAGTMRLDLYIQLAPPGQ